MKFNPLKNRSARERARARQEEIEKQNAQRAQINKENISVMWIIAIAIAIMAIGLVAINYTHDITLFDAVAQCIGGILLVVYSVFGHIMCKKHNISEIITQLDIILLAAIYLIGNTIFFVLR